jgi:hypothetical protein
LFALRVHAVRVINHVEKNASCIVHPPHVQLKVTFERLIPLHLIVLPVVVAVKVVKPVLVLFILAHNSKFHLMVILPDHETVPVYADVNIRLFIDTPVTGTRLLLQENVILFQLYEAKSLLRVHVIFICDVLLFTVKNVVPLLFNLVQFIVLAHRVNTLTPEDHKLNDPQVTVFQFVFSVHKLRVKALVHISRVSCRVWFHQEPFWDTAEPNVIQLQVTSPVPVESVMVQVYVLVIPLHIVSEFTIVEAQVPAKVPVNQVKFRESIDVLVVLVTVPAHELASKNTSSQTQGTASPPAHHDVKAHLVPAVPSRSSVHPTR